MGYFQDEVEDAFGYVWAKVILTAVVIFAIYIVVAFFLSMWPFSVARDVAHKTVNATSIISNYEWFYDQYNSIQAQEANINALPKDATERSGMIMVLNNNIAEYNSRSKQITRNMWKPSDLPYQIEMFTSN